MKTYASISLSIGVLLIVACAQPVRRPEEVRHDSITNSIGMTFVHISPGTFTMGSPLNEPGRKGDEGQHQVTLSKGFYLQTSEVTVGQWHTFVQDTGYRSEAETGGGCRIWFHTLSGSKYVMRAQAFWHDSVFSQSEDHPVTCVSWNDAMAFIEWLSQKEDISYRLPTEAEWEYAARAGSITVAFWGDNPSDACRFANVFGIAERQFRDKIFQNLGYSSAANGVNNSSWIDSSCDDGYKETSPVGHFQPNAFGLYDMLGNVWEWCQSWYGEYPPGVVTDSIGPSKSLDRVLRGGAWNHAPDNIRSAMRHFGLPRDRSNGVGFRIVRDISIRDSSENDSNEVSDESIKKLLNLSGLTAQVNQFPGVIKEGMRQAKQQGAAIPDAEFRAMLRCVDESILSSEMLEGIRSSLKKSINEDEAQDLLAWYESDLGKEITAAEERASTPEAYRQMMKEAQSLLTNTERVEFAERFDGLFGGTEMTMDLQEISALAVYSAIMSAMQPGVPLNLDPFKAQMDAASARTRAAIEQMVVASYVYSYQGIDTEKLKKYEAFLNKPIASKFNRIIMTSIKSEFETSISKWAVALVLMFKNKRQQI